MTSHDPGPPPGGGREPAPRDPKRVRFWGWMAFAAAILIVIIGLLIGRPWNQCHCPLHKHSLPAPPALTEPFAPARVAAAPR